MRPGRKMTANVAAVPGDDRSGKTTPGKKAEASPVPALLLDWYDRHRRNLPWRAAPGETPDPYRVWLSEIMLQQTTVRAVVPYFLDFVERWPEVAGLAAAPRDAVLSAWAGLGYYARARNLHACAVVVAQDHGGVFPDTVEGLRRLPGIGAYTAAAVAAIAFNRPVMPVDGNIERVVARLFAVEEPLPAAKPRIHEQAATLVPTRSSGDIPQAASPRAGDMAQALMDLGATICTPRAPACALCPLNAECVAFARGAAESFPRKADKKEGRLRRGLAFVATRADGAVLLRTRADDGLLGGMSEVPSSDWVHDFDSAAAMKAAPSFARRSVDWRRLPGIVRHTFTHFPLELTVMVAALPQAFRAPDAMRFTTTDALHREALPTLMRKVLAHAGIAVRKSR